MTAAKFLEEAWRLANAKARELGWISSQETYLSSGWKREPGVRSPFPELAVARGR
jgi:hypothetical protein